MQEEKAPHPAIILCVCCIVLPLVVLFIVSYILMYTNELPDLNDVDNDKYDTKTYTAWYMAFIVEWAMMVLFTILGCWT
jgi:magnesium-transporting ATPase (P-type)